MDDFGLREEYLLPPPCGGDKIAWGDDTKVSELGENSRNGILCTPRVNPPRKRRIYSGPMVTYGKSFLRAFTREKRYLTCVSFPFLSSPRIVRFERTKLGQF